MVSLRLVGGRKQAFAAVLAGEVRVDGELCLKPDTRVDAGAVIDYRPTGESYVSRGGLKLAGALDFFQIDVAGRAVLDAGASTGGFTDCLLKRGAARVTAVDVGYGQLAWKLRCDPRVEVMERTNLRYLLPENLPVRPDTAVLDLSFISLKTVMPAVVRCLTDEGEVLALVKPQFEVGKGRVGRSGIVKDARLHVEVMVDLCTAFKQMNLHLLNMTFSPILGAKGNIEYWLYLSKPPADRVIKDVESMVERTVDEAMRCLRRGGGRKNETEQWR